MALATVYDIAMSGGSSFAPAPAVMPVDMYRRINALRGNSIGAINTIGWLSLLVLIPTTIGILHTPATLILALLLETSNLDEGVVMIIYVFGLFGTGILLSIGLMLLVRVMMRRSFSRWHAQVWHELHTTNLAVLVVDDAYSMLVRDRISEIYGLNWMSPPPPKKLEDQIEFAACYHVALRKLLWGVGRLENSPLWQGSASWYAGTTRGCACGCVALWLLSLIGAGVWIFGAVLHLKRCAVQAAYCDFLLKDDIAAGEQMPQSSEHNPGSL